MDIVRYLLILSILVIYSCSAKAENSWKEKRGNRRVVFQVDNPVKRGRYNVKTTVFKKGGKTLITLGNFSNSFQKVSLKINFEKSGFEAVDAKLVASEI